MEKDQLTRKLAVILHADVVGSTSIVQKDERLANERIEKPFRHFGDTISKNHGRVHGLRGDALLPAFERASDASHWFFRVVSPNAERTADLLVINMSGEKR